MRVYLAGGAPKPLTNKLKNYLFSFYGIKFPIHRFGTFSDFKFLSKTKEIMKIYLAGSIAGKTREREVFLKKTFRLMSFYEINSNLFNFYLSFKIRINDPILSSNSSGE